MNVESISFIIIIIVIMILIGIRFYKELTKPIYVNHRAYKKWLIQVYGFDVTSMASQIYHHLRSQHQNTYDVVEEMTGDKEFNSKTYIKTARGIIAQIKYADRYGYLETNSKE